MALSRPDESLQSWVEWNKELERERAEEAHANGFSCWAKYERKLEEDYRQLADRHEEFLCYQCAATGKTRDEVEADLFPDNAKSPVHLLPTPELCDCEG